MKNNSLKSTILVFMLLLGISPLFIISQPAMVQAAGSSSFTDISSHWAKDTILWAVDEGIVNGYPDGTFKPNQGVTEAQFLTMLIRAYRPDIQNGVDEHWASPFYRLANELNYPVSETKDTAKMNETLLRTGAAELISATQGVNYKANDAITYILGHQLANGTDPNNRTVLNFNGSKPLTRAEAITFIENLLEKGKKELSARPTEPSDPKLLPYVPLGDEKEQDLPYKVPSDWTSPRIKSTATENYNENRVILEDELSLIRGIYYNPYGGKQPEFAEVVVEDGGEDFIAHITFYSWYGSKTAVHQLNKIPYVTKELFKFYLPSEHDTLFKVMDDNFNGKDVSSFINKPFELDERQIKIVKSPFSVSVFIGVK